MRKNNFKKRHAKNLQLYSAVPVLTAKHAKYR